MGRGIADFEEKSNVAHLRNAERNQEEEASIPSIFKKAVA
jgi:hypothetical protein